MLCTNAGGGRNCVGAGVKLVSIAPPRGEYAPRRTAMVLAEPGDHRRSDMRDGWNDPRDENPFGAGSDIDVDDGDGRGAAGSSREMPSPTPSTGMESDDDNVDDGEVESDDDNSDKLWTFLLRAHHMNGQGAVDRMIEKVSAPSGGQCVTTKGSDPLLEATSSSRIDINASEAALYQFCMEHSLSTTSADALIAMIKNPAFNCDDIRFLRLNSYLQRTYMLMSTGIQYRCLQNVSTDGTNSGDFWYRWASDIASDMLSDPGFAREMQWEFKKDFSATGDIQHWP